jgi:PAS domain S-box-containing protein
VARLNEQALRPEALLEAAATLIPAGFYAPEATTVCLSYAGRQYLSQPLPPGDAALQNTVNIGPEALNLQIFIQPDATRPGQKAYLSEEAELVQALTELLALKLQRQLSQQALQQSHQRYAYLMQASFDAIWDWDLQSDQVTWGSGIESLFGHSRAELPADSSSWSALIHPDERDSVLAGLQATIQNKTALRWSKQYRLRRADQQYALIEDKGLIMRDPETGEALHMIGAMRDITQAEAEAQRLERAYHVAGIGTWEYHLPSERVHWSRVTREIHGIAEPDFHPDLNTSMAFYLPEDRPQILAAVQQAMQHGTPWDLSAHPGRGRVPTGSVPAPVWLLHRHSRPKNRGTGAAVQSPAAENPHGHQPATADPAELERCTQ